MAELVVNTDRIVGNIIKLNEYMQKHNIEWTLISKILSGNREILTRLLNHPSIKQVHSIGDSRLSSLKTIKKLKSDIVTMYIKPPAIQHVKSVVQFADISLNSSFSTIQALNQEAKKQDKIHRVIIMIELGELREGILREGILEFYQKTFELSHIRIDGIGTNLGCMYGVEPTYDKLIQLCLYKQLLEAKFNFDLKLVSGGSSITLPLICKNKIPHAMNHFRIGEAAFLGKSPFHNKRFRNLSTKAFEYDANIIEMYEKETVPDGNISEASVGHTSEEQEQAQTRTYRAILDFGILDVDVKELTPKDSRVNFAGTTSDMTVYDLGANISKSRKAKYKVGKKVRFEPTYMAVARLMNSKFIRKIVR